MFINTTETLGVILARGTTYTTGSIFLSLFILMVFLVVVAILFGIRLDFAAILILPLLLSYMAYYSEFIAIGSVIIIYIGMVFAQKFLIK